MYSYVGIVALMHDGLVSFRRSDIFNAASEEEAYEELDKRVDQNMSAEEQSHICNDWVLNLDDPTQASLVLRNFNN